LEQPSKHRASLFRNIQWCVAKTPVRCPRCGREEEKPFHIIIHLNDHHRWSREAIADWVEVLEAKLGVQDHSGVPRWPGLAPALLTSEAEPANAKADVPAWLAAVLMFKPA
jgi:hypothetical protein